MKISRKMPPPRGNVPIELCQGNPKVLEMSRFLVFLECKTANESDFKMVGMNRNSNFTRLKIGIQLCQREN